MARFLDDGTIQLGDGRLVFPHLAVAAQDIGEIAQLLNPLPFSGFGGGGGAGPAGPAGPTGPAGAVASGNKLGEAYNQGGAHLGRTINVDAGFPGSCETASCHGSGNP